MSCALRRAPTASRATCGGDEQTQRRAVLRARAALDVARLLKRDERRLHGHLVAHAGARGDLARRELDALLARADERLVDFRDELGRRVRAFDEVVLRALVGVVEEEQADRGQRRRARRGRSPDSRPRWSRAGGSVRRSVCRACRCPCRRRWWRRSSARAPT